LIERFALFAEVPTDDCEAILFAAREKNFSREEIIFSKGDPVREVIMLLSGCVKVVQTGLYGNEIIPRSHGAGEIIGSLLLRQNNHQCSTAQAVQPSTALVWEATAFEKFVARVPAFRRNIIRALEERLRELEQRSRELERRLREAQKLLRLSDRLGRSNGHLGYARTFWTVFLWAAIGLLLLVVWETLKH